MLFSNVEDVNDVPNEDFLQLPSGYCFSINELIDWLIENYSSITINISSINYLNDINFEIYIQELVYLLKKYRSQLNQQYWDLLSQSYDEEDIITMQNAIYTDTVD